MCFVWLVFACLLACLRDALLLLGLESENEQKVPALYLFLTVRFPILDTSL